jgi:hypothetical protein
MNSYFWKINREKKQNLVITKYKNSIKYKKY